MKKTIIGVVALSIILSVGVASATNENGIPGLIEKLDEIKNEITSLNLSVPEPLNVNVLNHPTSSTPFPEQMDVTVLNPTTNVTIQEPLDVNVVNEPNQTITKWEYKLINFPGYGDVTQTMQTTLNLHGPQGWELAHVSQEYDGPQIWYTLYLKRPTTTNP